MSANQTPKTFDWYEVGIVLLVIAAVFWICK